MGRGPVFIEGGQRSPQQEQQPAPADQPKDEKESRGENIRSVEAPTSTLEEDAAQIVMRDVHRNGQEHVRSSRNFSQL